MLGGCGAFIELMAGDLALVAAHARAREGQAARPCLPVRLAGRLVMAAAERGQLTEARRALEAMARSDSSTLGVLEPLYWWAQGTLARAEGDVAAAAAALRRTVSGNAATRAAARAEDTARRTGVSLHQALHLLARSWALIGRGQHDRAARVALRAAEGFSCRGYALLAARARVAYAHAAQQSDRDEARDALRRAIGAFDACGAAVRRDEAATLLHRLEPAKRCSTAAVHGSGALTRRERQVAELAAGGYTAAQIATHLHIGVRTVETHLAHSYAKLGVSCKQQLVLRRTELGLAPGR
jgi:DNA-binding CsgD family transcriptional regulator